MSFPRTLSVFVVSCATMVALSPAAGADTPVDPAPVVQPAAGDAGAEGAVVQIDSPVAPQTAAATTDFMKESQPASLKAATSSGVEGSTPGVGGWVLGVVGAVVLAIVAGLNHVGA